MDSLKHALTEYGTHGAVVALGAAVLRYLRPRRVLSFLTAVKEREDMKAAADYWEQEAARRERQHQICRTERDALDQELSALRTRIRSGAS